MAAPLNDPGPGAAPAVHAPVNVLLVDDQPARLLSYRAILDSLGENLVEARSGAEALQRLMEDEFALILLDVNMPGMDGFETASMIHEHPRFEKTPIIFVTAINVTDLDRLRGYKLGAVDYVTVPVIPEILRGKVMVLTELFRKRRELLQANRDLAHANAALKVEQAREVNALNDHLHRANQDLAAINASLQAEIVERRAAEQRMRFLAETIPSIVWTCASDGAVTYGNRNWRAFYGFEAVGVVPQRMIGFSVHPDDSEAVSATVSVHLAAGTAFEFEARHRRHDGSYRWFITRAVPWHGDTGEIVSWFGLTTDIHDQKVLQERLRETDRRKDEFLATLAHELRNPLAPIRSALHALRMSPEIDKRQQLQAIMERQMRQMVRLIDDLLDVSRISRGKLTLRRQRIAFRQVIDVALETVRPMVADAGHTLHLDLPERDCMLHGDPQRLSQVFANLLNNACKYTEPGGSIWLSAATARGMLRVTLRDSGIGLSADDLQQVFELFAQVDASLERTRGGLGIGLTLVRQLIDMHGGQVQAHSDGPGCGSVFTVTLPLAAALDDEPAEPSADGPAVAARGLRVMVVDDNNDAADTLAMSLDMLGHRVLTIYDPLQALVAAQSFNPQLAFLDVGMPNLNGFDLARRMRESAWAGQTMLVALTGWGQQDDRRRSSEAGFDRHIVKPIDLEAIAAICTEAAGRSGTSPAGSDSTADPGAAAPARC